MQLERNIVVKAKKKGSLNLFSQSLRCAENATSSLSN